MSPEDDCWLPMRVIEMTTGESLQDVDVKSCVQALNRDTPQESEHKIQKLMGSETQWWKWQTKRLHQLHV